MNGRVSLNKQQNSYVYKLSGNTGTAAFMKALLSVQQ